MFLMIKNLNFLYILIIFIGCSATVEKRFVNSDGSTNQKSFKDLLQWQIKKNRPDPEVIKTTDDYKDYDLNSNDPYAIWIGHASFLINNGDLKILIDPIFSNRASPISFAGPKRMIKPALSFHELPNIDVILISHNHYDHLDITTLKKLKHIFPNVQICLPKGDQKLLMNNNIKDTKEFEWWDVYQISNTTITFLPSQHWSARGFTDRNKSLWGSWMISSNELNLYHAGDTGYSSDFIKIQKEYDTIDFAMIPIGAYSPQWFMKYAHVTPEEAVQIAIDLKAKKSVGMHWGTFILSDEPVLEPKERLKIAASRYNINFDTVVPGEYILLSN